MNTLLKNMKRRIAFLMAVVMLVCNVQIPAFADAKYSSYLDGWTVQTAWSNLSHEYEWNASHAEIRQPKIIVTYRLENADKEYPAGSLQFSTPGIGNANRASLMKASQLAADKEDSEWDYTWDQNTDTYIFTNKFDVNENESVSGGFELLWTLNARDCMDGFKQSKSPMFSINTEDGNGSIVLEPLSFQFSSVKDLYRLSMTREKLTGAEYDSSDKDYIWYTIRTRFDKDWNSRGIYKADYFVSVEIPAGESYEDVRAEYNGKEVTLEEKNGEYGFFPFQDRQGDIGSQYSTYSLDFKLGFKRETLKEDQVTVRGHLDRLYHDESDWIRESIDGNTHDIPDAELSFTIDDYSFVHQGYIYDHEKWNTSYENWPYNHEEPSNYGDRMNATNLYNGKIVQFQLYGKANRNYAVGKMKARNTISLATPSNISAFEKEPEIPEGIADWNDIHWQENGLAKATKDSFAGIQYGDYYSENPLATPSNAEYEETDGFFVPDIDIWGSLSTLYGKVSSLFFMTSYAANDIIATPSESGKDSSDRATAANQMTKALDEKVSQIEENQEYSLVMGDDKLAIFLNNGKIRPLEDREYDIAYVTVPSDSRKYDYEIWGAYSSEVNPDQNGQDTSFGDYVLLGTGNTEKSQTFQFINGVKAVFIRVNGIKGSYNYNVYVGVRMHLDWMTEQEKEFGERPDHENRFVNFSYLRALYTDGNQNDLNDCALTEGNYEGTYGEELAERDKDLYGEYLLRDYSNVWLRSAVTDLKTETKLGEFSGGGKAGFSTTLSGSGFIKADNEGSLERFSMYMSIPEGIQIDIDEKPIKITGTAIDVGGFPVGDFQNHVTVSTKQIYNRTYLVVDFAFSDIPLEVSEMTKVNVSLPATLSYADYISCGNQYSMNTYLMVHDDGIDKISGSAIMSDSYDLDEDGSAEERMAYSGDSKTVLDNANEWRQYVSKYVKSAYSAGYVTDTVTKLFVKTDTEEEKKKSDYSYRLDFALGSDNARNIVFFDRIEQGARIADNVDDPEAYTDIASEWQGQFVSVDTSQIERLKMVPTVYYSTDPNQELDLSVGGWSTKIPQNPGDVKAVAVAADTAQMENGMMKAGQMVYVEINMRAPEDVSFVGKRAVNQHYVQYDAYGLTDELVETMMLPSSETYVRLLDTVGKIILQKVDAENVTSTDEDGTRHYAPLSGAKFQVYDGSGDTAKALFDEPKELNSAGRIVLKNMPYGMYFWEEVEAPAGYQKIEGRHPFEIDGITEIVNIENKRIPGSVTLTKQDADNKAYGPLSGAVYELFRSDGTQVFTDKDYRYSDSGSNSEFVTAMGGTFTITNLPWGNYYFLEKEAPQGYELSNQKWEFSVGREQYDAMTNTVTTVLETYDYEMTADLLLIKTDSTSKKPIKNAMYSLYKETGSEDELVLSGLKTNAAGELKVKGLKFGSYYFVENRSADGYLMPDEENARTEIVTLDESTVGTEVKVFHTNDRMEGNVQLLKTDDANQLVGGAEYTLYYKADTSEEDKYEEQGVYVTNNDRESDDYGTISVTGLKWGSYYFVETKAPQGYEVSNEYVEFVIDADTVQNTIFLEIMDFRKTGSVKLVKVEKNRNDITLAGAGYELYRTDGSLCKAGIDYVLPDGGNEIITGSDGTVVLTGIKQGGYYFKETKAPEGYSLSPEFIRFSITKENCDIVQELLAEDETGKAVITINKEVNEVYDSFGSPTFLFEITRDDGQKYFKSITLAKGALSGSVSLTVEQAHSYTIQEIDVARYELKEIEAGENVTVIGDVATANLKVGTYAEVTFHNRIEQYEKFSHVTNATNVVKAATKLTGIMVDYTGPNPVRITDNLPEYDDKRDVYMIPESDLIVTACYDDGTTTVLSPFDYWVESYVVDCSTNNESFTGTVSYMESDMEKTGKFQIDMDYSGKPRRHWVTFALNGGEIFSYDDWETVTTLVKSVKSGSTIEKPTEDPYKYGYDFCGWFTDSACLNEATFQEIITSNMTYYAKWEEHVVRVKYAVSIYGIQQDTDEQGNVLGLTFGPASGESYADSYKDHSPSDGQMCMHGMTWEQIIAQSKEDPNVFRECMENSCTHSVNLAIKGPLASPFGNYDMIGDGAGTLHNSFLANNGLYGIKWNAVSDNTGGWPASGIRAYLNGVDANTDAAVAGTQIMNLDASNTLISAFPVELQNSIVPKAVKSDTVYNDITGNNKITHDKLWLFSVEEIYGENSPCNRPNEGVLYERQKLLGDNFRKNILYNEGGTMVVNSNLRTIHKEYNTDVYYINAAGHASGHSIYYTTGISPGFCLK